LIQYPPEARHRARIATRTRVEGWLGPRGIVLGSVLVASLVLVVRPVMDTDYWLHLSAGRWIVEHGRLPAHDLFTYTVPDHRWVNHEYLSEVILWLLQSRFGMAGASVVFGLLAWLGLVLVLAACRPGRHPYGIVGMAMLLAAIAAAPIWGARPQMVTFTLASLELLWLRSLLEDPESRAILWLPAVMVLWSNLHGGWPVGFLFLAVAFAAALLRWAGDRSDASHLPRLRRLALAGALSVLAVGLNPNGLAVYAYPFQTLTSSAQQGLIAEWASPDFHLVNLRALELVVVLLVAGLAVGRPTAFDVLVALAGLALALESVRHIPLFAAAATPVLVATWSDAWRRFAPAALVGRRGAPPPRWAPAAGLAVLLGVSALTGPRIASELARQPELTRQIAPTGAADWLAAHPDVGTRMFNEYTWGGYLAARFYPNPDRRTFVISEGVLMGDAQLLRYRDVVALAPDWRRVLDQAHVDYVVFDQGTALDDVLATEPGWRVAYRDSTAVIYVRAAART
jgi:hypothetical protein